MRTDDLAKIKKINRNLRLCDKGHICSSAWRCCICNRSSYYCPLHAEILVPSDVEIIEDDDFHLNLDLDMAWVLRKLALRRVRRKFAPEDYVYWKSRNGNIHCRVTLKEAVPYDQRIQWQVKLGSDMGRMWHDDEKPSMLRRNVLFRPRQHED